MPMTAEKPRSRILAMTQWAEGLPISLGRWLLLLAAIIVLRHFLEQMSGQAKTLYFLSYFIHYPLAYVAPLLALSVLLAALARERIERVTKLMLFAWLLTLLPPLIDILAHRSAEAPQLIGYLIPRESSLWAAFVNLLNPAYQRFQGTTTGIRVEAALGCLLGAYYVFLKTRNAGRAVASFFAIYVTMFFFFALPPITLAVARFFGSESENVYTLFFSKADVHRAFVNATPFAVSDLSNALIDLFVIAPVLALWYRLYDRSRLSELVGDIDWTQAAFHVVAAVGGSALASRLLMNSSGLFSISQALDVVSLAGIFAASFFVSAAASGMRSIHENALRPRESLDSLRVHTAIHFSFACLFALSVSYVALTYVLAALASWYLYYAGPFKLRRFPLLGGFVAGAALLFTLSLGYSAYAGASASLWLPGSVSALCLFIPATSMLATEVWSPSDERFSLSSLLGASRARSVAGAGVFLSCLMPAAFLAMPWLLIPGVVAGCAGVVLLARVPGTLLPAGLGGLAAALVLAALLMGAGGAPVLRSQLEATDFSEASRRAGAFALSDESPEAAAAMEEGLELFQQGDYEAAAEAFRVVLETDPDNLDAYVSIGSSYLRLKRLSEAARAFRKALDLNAESAKARVGLGQTYQLYEDYDAAFEELTKALELAPDDPEVIYALAVFFQKVGNTEREIAALEETLAHDPGRATPYRRLAEIHMKAEMPEKAIETLNRALDSGTVFEHLHTQLAQAYYMTGDLEAAERETRREIERNPRLPSPHAVLAGLLAEQGERDEAIAEYGRAISLTSDASLKARLEEEIESLGGRPTQSAAP